MNSSRRSPCVQQIKFLWTKKFTKKTPSEGRVNQMISRNFSRNTGTTKTTDISTTGIDVMSMKTSLVVLTVSTWIINFFCRNHARWLLSSLIILHNFPIYIKNILLPFLSYLNSNFVHTIYHWYIIVNKLLLPLQLNLCLGEMLWFLPMGSFSRGSVAKGCT